MTFSLKTFALALPLVPLLSSATYAQAPPMGQPPGGEEEPKQEGMAEKAPKEAGQLPTLPPLPPYPNQERKRFELIELEGYARLRTSWFKNFNMGFHDFGMGVPFPEPLPCREIPMGMNVAVEKCGNSIGTGDMRVRLEPTIHLSESVALHLQVDLLDNLVLGSTSRGIFFDGISTDQSTPGSFFSTSQAPPEGGKNSPWDSVRVKQAWADVHTGIGDIRFGRMPNQWGMGIYANSGGYDWVHGETCLDCDFGDSVDRVMFGAGIPGTNLRGAIGYTWASSGPTSGQVDIWKNRTDGQPYDLEDSDDTTEWNLMITRIDDPVIWKQTLDEGKFAYNFGAYLAYRSQDFEARNVTLGSPNPEASYVARHASQYIADAWGRVTWSKITFEAEAVGIFGSIDNVGDPREEKQDIRMFGGAGRLSYLMLNDDLKLQLDVGFASGDQWEDDRPGVINVNDANYFPRDRPLDSTISNFRLNPDFRVDLILFKEIKGAVQNATYIRPSLTYNITERFRFGAAAIASLANVPVSTPGNSALYGVELDGDLGYYNETDGFFAGVSYGVLFPMAALDHPELLFPGSLDGKTSADTAQTFLMRLMLKF